MSDEESVHQLRFQRERKTNMAGAKPVTSKQIRKVKKQQRVPAFGRIDNKICTEKDWRRKLFFPVGPKTKLATPFYVAKPIISEHNELLESERVRVRKKEVLSKLPKNKKPHVQDRLLG